MAIGQKKGKFGQIKNLASNLNSLDVSCLDLDTLA